jgi:D-xylose transport system ATP-binding protein
MSQTESTTGAAAGSNDQPLLALKGFSKSFGAVEALKDVDFEVHPGEVVALVGDNGAGKSTLIKAISGAQPPDTGTVTWDGRQVRLSTPSDATAIGIATVYQDLALAENLDVVANLFLGQETPNRFPWPRWLPGPPTRPSWLHWPHRPSWLHLPWPKRFDRFKPRVPAGVKAWVRSLKPRVKVLDETAMEKKAVELLGSLGVTTLRSVRAEVAMLSGGQRQAVAIARSLLGEPKLVMLDEPTAALGIVQTAQILKLIHRLRERGLGVIVISHNLEDVFQVSDRIAVLRLGRVAASYTKGDVTREQVVASITGADVAERATEENPL